MPRCASQRATRGANRRRGKSARTISVAAPPVSFCGRRGARELTPALRHAGQIVAFKSVPLVEQDRWTRKDADSGQVEWAFDSARFDDRVLTAFTPDGSIVAAAFGNHVVSCRESGSGKELFRYTSPSPLRLLNLSTDGRTLITVSESGSVELCSLGTAKRLALAISEVPRKDARFRFAFSPDGTRLATSEWAVQGGATPLTVWDVGTGKRLEEYPGHRDRAADLLFAADGRSVAIAAGPTIRCWFLDGKPEPPPLAGHTEAAWAVAFKPDGSLVASGSGDDDHESIKLWDPNDRQAHHRLACRTRNDRRNCIFARRPHSGLGSSDE